MGSLRSRVDEYSEIDPRKLINDRDLLTLASASFPEEFAWLARHTAKRSRRQAFLAYFRRRLQIRRIRRWYAA